MIVIGIIIHDSGRYRTFLWEINNISANVMPDYPSGV